MVEVKHSQVFLIIKNGQGYILTIPISSIASESTFSTGGKILDDYRSSLASKIGDALVCTENWIRSRHTNIKTTLV